MDRRIATRQIIEFVIQAQDIALQVGIPNILQPGLVKEMIVADILGHVIISSKRDADACDAMTHPSNTSI